LLVSRSLPYSSLAFCSFYRVSEDLPLYDILNEFQKGHSHIAVVYKDLNANKETPKNEFKDSCRKRGKTETSHEKGES
jgi:metal transporter CNNM